MVSISLAGTGAERTYVRGQRGRGGSVRREDQVREFHPILASHPSLADPNVPGGEFLWSARTSSASVVDFSAPSLPSPPYRVLVRPPQTPPDQRLRFGSI